MDSQLQQRLRVYEQEGLASPAIVQFVRNTLLWLEQQAQQSCTEENAGPLASHLMLALARVSRGETLGEAWDTNVHEEAQQQASLTSWAEHICQQASQVLHLPLPDEELDFLLLHLGVFKLRSDESQQSQSSQHSPSAPEFVKRSPTS